MARSLMMVVVFALILAACGAPANQGAQGEASPASAQKAFEKRRSEARRSELDWRSIEGSPEELAGRTMLNKVSGAPENATF